jgi:hypothetical protein
MFINVDISHIIDEQLYVTKPAQVTRTACPWGK